MITTRTFSNQGDSHSNNWLKVKCGRKGGVDGAMKMRHSIHNVAWLPGDWREEAIQTHMEIGGKRLCGHTWAVPEREEARKRV